MAKKSGKRGAPSLIQEGWWDGLSDSARHGICLGVLFALAFAFYAPIVFTGQSLFGGDTVSWRAMAEFILEYEEESGEEALWAPNAFAGMPGYMISYSMRIPQVDAVPGLLRGVIWPVSHVIFLLAGTYLLVFYLTRNHLAGVMAAAAFGLTTYLEIILVAGHNSKFITLCFTPWLALTFAYVLRRPTLLSALLFAAALGVNLRAGHVQITYYVTMLLGIWWIVELVGAVRRGEWKHLGTATGYLVLGSVLGLILVAQPYLANFEYKNYTIRGAAESAAAGLDWEYAMNWSQGVGELITLIAADAFGGASPTYWGPKTLGTSGPHYVGAVVSLFAMLAVWRWRRNVTIGFAVGAFVMTLFSLGSNFPLLNRFMYEHFPLFNAFRVPETWLSVVALALAVLGGFGLHAAGRDETPQAERAVYAAAGGMAGLLIVLWLFGGAFFDFEAPSEGARVTQQLLAQQPEISPDDPRVAATVDNYLSEQREARRAVYSSDVLRSLLFVIAAAGLLTAFRRGKMPRWTMQAAVAMLVIVDLWGVGRRYFNEADLVHANDIEQQIATYDFDRFILERQQEAGGMGRFRVLSLESGSPFQNGRPSYHFESVGGYHGAKLQLIQDYIDDLFFDPQTRGPNDNAMDLLNVRYVIAGGGVPGLTPVFQGEQTGLYVLENTDALPRAFFAGETEIIESEPAMIERLRSEAFDPRETALLYEPIAFDPAPIDSASIARAEVASYTPDEIVLDVETDESRLLVLSEIFYPAGWRAEVSGEEAPIYQVDHLLRGVPVPAGRHDIVLRFAPSSHKTGIWVSGVTTVLVYGLIVGLLAVRWRRRRGDEPDGEKENSE